MSPFPLPQAGVPACAPGVAPPCLPPGDIGALLSEFLGHWRATTVGITSPTMLVVYGGGGVLVAGLCIVLMGTTFRRANIVMRAGLALTMLWGLTFAVGCWYMRGRFLWPAETAAVPGVALILVALSTTDRAEFLGREQRQERFGPLHPARLLSYLRRWRTRRGLGP